jgi:hypothetical protein
LKGQEERMCRVLPVKLKFMSRKINIHLTLCLIQFQALQTRRGVEEKCHAIVNIGINCG